eukprot:6492429-Amphidinium_carterae.1
MQGPQGTAPAPPAQVTILGKGGKKPAGAGTGGRGRPKKDWSVAVQGWREKMVASTLDDVLFWGAESKTTLRTLKGDEKDILARIKKSDNIEETTSLQKSHKLIKAMLEIVEVVDKSGFDSENFCKVYDMQSTALALEPSVDAPWPPFVVWIRERAQIAECESDDAWWARILSAALKEAKCENILESQEALFSERLAKYLKLDDAEAALANLLKTDRDLDLEGNLPIVVCCLAALLHSNEVPLG